MYDTTFTACADLASFLDAARAAGARAREADLRPNASRAAGLGTPNELIAWLRAYRADEEALDRLTEADRERVYSAAWGAYTGTPAQSEEGEVIPPTHRAPSARTLRGRGPLAVGGHHDQRLP